MYKCRTLIWLCMYVLYVIDPAQGNTRVFHTIREYFIIIVNCVIVYDYHHATALKWTQFSLNISIVCLVICGDQSILIYELGNIILKIIYNFHTRFLIGVYYFRLLLGLLFKFNLPSNVAS